MKEGRDAWQLMAVAAFFHSIETSGTCHDDHEKMPGVYLICGWENLAETFSSRLRLRCARFRFAAPGVKKGME
jgi:hypothetical protein